MVSFVVITHSETLARGVAEEAKMMAPEAVIIPAGGTDDGGLGTSALKIENAINEAMNDDGVIILVDMGSALMTAQVVIEDLDEKLQNKVSIADCPLLEGAVTGCVLADAGESIEGILEDLSQVAEQKKTDFSL